MKYGIHEKMLNKAIKIGKSNWSDSKKGVKVKLCVLTNRTKQELTSIFIKNL